MNDLKLPSDSGEQELNIVQSYMGRQYPAFVFNYIDDQGIGQTSTFQLYPSRLMAISKLLQSAEHKMIEVLSKTLLSYEDEMKMRKSFLDPPFRMSDIKFDNVIPFKKRD